MTVIWILFVCSIVLLPCLALLAMRWAIRHGEFQNLQKQALSIFDEEEPLGRMTDHFPGASVRMEERTSTTQSSEPPQANVRP